MSVCQGGGRFLCILLITLSWDIDEEMMSITAGEGGCAFTRTMLRAQASRRGRFTTPIYRSSVDLGLTSTVKNVVVGASKC